ncbi:MAG: hypothetical protein RXS42_06185 [Nitrososphaeria archaeon]
MAQSQTQIKGAEILDKVKGPCRDNIGWTAAYLTRKYKQGGTIVMERTGDVVTVRVNKRAVIEIVRGSDGKCSLRTAYYGSKIVTKYTDKCPCDAIDALVEGIKKLVMFGDEQLLEWIAEYLRPSTA